MKKISLMVCLFLGFFLVELLPVYPEEGKVTLTLQEYQKLLQKKTYRLGFRAGMLFPSDATTLKDKSAIQGGLEFDAKLNENLDTGPRIAVSQLTVEQSDVNASYSVLQFGYGGRFYLLSWGEDASSHGLVNLYGSLEIQFMIANKISDVNVLLTNPSNYAGFGGYGGVGLEIGFGANSSGYGEMGYQLTQLKSSNDKALPLKGYLITAGLRLSFF